MLSSPLNHQVSRRLIDFAVAQQAGTIQLEDLTGLKDGVGTFLGQRWRYAELQQYIEYTAHEVGIAVKFVDPQFTSRRCSNCGFIDIKFDGDYRARNKPENGVCQFNCPEGDADPLDPDFNAAKNLTVKRIDNIIQRQLRKQGLESRIKVKKKKKSKKA